MSDLKFDPMTGQPIKDQTSGYKFDPITGQPIDQQSYSNQQTYGTQQQNSFGYDPVAIEREQSRKNKKLAVRVLAICAVALFALFVVGGIQLTKYILANASDKEPDTRITAETPVEDPIEEPAVEPVEDPVQEPSNDPVSDPDSELTGSTGDEPIPERAPEFSSDDVVGEEPYEEPAPDTTVSSTDAANDPYDMFSLEIGDDLYHIPCKVTDLLDRGWTFDDVATEKSSLGSKGYDYLYMYYPGTDRGTISVKVTNFSINSEIVRDCYITQIHLGSYDAENIGKSITSYGGVLEIGKSTRSDVKDIFGTPAYEYDNSIQYYGEGKKYFEPLASFGFEDGILDYISLNNENEPSDLTQAEVNSEKPDYLWNYEAPSSLGSDPLSGNFKMDGVVYSLPVPFTKLIDQGWEYNGDLEYTAGAGLQYVVQFQKDNRTLTATCYNPSDTATYLKYTIVTRIHAEDSTFDAVVEFPGGLTPSMSETELLAFMTKNGITNYEYRRETELYIIPFDQTGKNSNDRYEIFVQDGKISFMYAQNYSWTR